VVLPDDRAALVSGFIEEQRIAPALAAFTIRQSIDGGEQFVEVRYWL
jgi:hypothetical protein